MKVSATLCKISRVTNLIHQFNMFPNPLLLFMRIYLNVCQSSLKGYKNYYKTFSAVPWRSTFSTFSTMGSENGNRTGLDGK